MKKDIINYYKYSMEELRILLNIPMNEEIVFAYQNVEPLGEDTFEVKTRCKNE